MKEDNRLLQPSVLARIQGQCQLRLDRKRQGSQLPRANIVSRKRKLDVLKLKIKNSQHYAFQNQLALDCL